MRTLLTFVCVSAWMLPGILASPMASSAVENVASALPRAHYAENVTEPKRPIIQHVQKVVHPQAEHVERAKYCRNLTDGRPVIIHGDQRDCILHDPATETNATENQTPTETNETENKAPRAHYIDDVPEPKCPVIVRPSDESKTGNPSPINSEVVHEADSFNVKSATSEKAAHTATINSRINAAQSGQPTPSETRPKEHTAGKSGSHGDSSPKVSSRASKLEA